MHKSNVEPRKFLMKLGMWRSFIALGLALHLSGWEAEASSQLHAASVHERTKMGSGSMSM
jgi:hypothetical protein